MKLKQAVEGDTRTLVSELKYIKINNFGLFEYHWKEKDRK